MSGAVIFDLFHTLVDTEHLRPEGFEAIASVAGICRVGHAPFAAFWTDTYVERETHPIDLVDLVQRFCHSVGVALTDDQRIAIDDTFGVCKDDALRQPDAAMVDLVAEIATFSPVGVLSNCHEREVRCWPDSPFAPLVAAFGRSTQIGAMKPDSVTYRWVLDHVGVDPAASCYVGNGSSDELTGARAAGFATVIHCNIFDRMNGLVSPDEQRRRAKQADISVESIDQLRSEQSGPVRRGRID